MTSAAELGVHTAAGETSRRVAVGSRWDHGHGCSQVGMLCKRVNLCERGSKCDQRPCLQLRAREQGCREKACLKARPTQQLGCCTSPLQGRANRAQGSRVHRKCIHLACTGCWVPRRAEAARGHSQTAAVAPLPFSAIRLEVSPFCSCPQGLQGCPSIAASSLPPCVGQDKVAPISMLSRGSSSAHQPPAAGPAGPSPHNSDALPPELACPLCHELYLEPVLTPCRHAFCR